MATLGGPAIPVSVQTGGQVQGGAAIPVAVVTDGRAQQGGPAQPVQVVTSGPVQGGPALPVVAAAAGTSVAAGPAIKVYVVSGILGGAVPVNLTPPTISGTANVGQTLTATTGTWSNSPTSYTYQWNRNGVAIGGATASTYVLTASDAGTTIAVTVTATNTSGAASATSAGTVASFAAFSNPIGTAPKLVFDAIDSFFALADGTLIDTWTDQGSLLKNLTAAGGLRPTKATLNGYPCASFSGANNMNTAVFAGALSQPNTVFVLLQTSNIAAFQVFHDGEGGNRNMMATNVDTFPYMYAGTQLGGAVAATGAAANVLAAIYNGASSKLWVNGGSATISGNAGTQTLPKLWVGSNFAAGQFLTGKIHGVYVFNASLSLADLTTFGQYLGTRYGVTVAAYS